MKPLTLCILAACWAVVMGAPLAGDAAEPAHDSAAQVSNKAADPADAQLLSRSGRGSGLGPRRSAAFEPCIPEQIRGCDNPVTKFRIRCALSPADSAVAVVKYRCLSPGPAQEQVRIVRQRDGFEECGRIKPCRRGVEKAKVRIPIDFPGQKIEYCVEDRQGQKCTCRKKRC